MATAPLSTARIATSSTTTGDNSPTNAAPTDAARRLRAKLDARLLPLLAAGFALCFLDRANIGFAVEAGMARDLHLSSTQFGKISMVMRLALVSPSHAMIPAYTSQDSTT